MRKRKRSCLWILTISLFQLALLTGCSQESYLSPKEASKPTVNEKTVIATIDKLGGQVLFDKHNSGLPVVSVNLSNTRVTDKELKLLKNLPKLRLLFLDGTKVTDEAVRRLRKQLPDCKIFR